MPLPPGVGRGCSVSVYGGLDFPDENNEGTPLDKTWTGLSGCGPDALVGSSNRRVAATGYPRYPFRTYLAALAVTELPYAVAVVYLGESFIRQNATAFLVLGVASILLGIRVLRIFDKLRGRLPLDRP